MLKYELKKIVASRTVIILVAFLVIFNAIVILKNNYKSDILYTTQLELYDEMQNMTIEDSIKYIEKKINNIDNSNADKSFAYMQASEGLLSEVMELKEYKEFCSRLSSESIGLAEGFEANNQYFYKLNMEIANRLVNRNIVNIRNVNKYKELIDYRLSYIFVLLAVVIGTSGIFSGEKELKTYGCIKSSVNGRERITIVKMVAAMIYALVISLFFAVSNYLCFWICYRFQGIESPIYQINSYHGEAFNTLSNSTILAFLVKNFCLSSLGILAITMLVIFFSQLFHDKKLTFWISIFCIIGFIFLRSFLTVGVGQTINLFNPINLLLADKAMLYFETTDLFEHVVYNEYLSSIFIFAEMLILQSLTYIVYRYNGIRLKRRK